MPRSDAASPAASPERAARRRADATRSRAATFLLLLLLNLATLAPCLAPSAMYLPQLVTYVRHGGVIFLMATAVASTYLFLGVMRGARCLSSGSTRFMVPLVSCLLVVLCVALMGTAAFYAKFGAYPSATIVLEFLAAPPAFLAYTRSGASVGDLLVFGTAVAVSVGLGVVVTRRVSLERVATHRALWNMALGSALLWTFRDSPTQPGAARFLIAEHSMPAARYAYALADQFDSNRVELARRYTPRPANAPVVPAVAKARHVLLVIAECLRADRLPADGYARNTTPFIQSEGDKWLKFHHAYAHGPATADNFPVLFNSQYFAAITRDNHGASELWRFLRDSGAGSAFLSAGAMEWAGITHSLDLGQAGDVLIASSVDRAARWKTTERQFDYAVDDAIPLRRYFELLEREFSARSSFVAMHFVGSHYPFEYDDTPDLFVPSLRRPADPQGTADATRDRLPLLSVREFTNATVRRISNSFDNSIVHVDGLVRQTVEALERLGIADDSVVIFTSDHGESLGEHQTFFHGSTLYDEQVHVPLLIRVGAHLGEIRTLLESRQSEVVGQIDLMPTILHMLSGTAPAIEPFEGVSLLTGARKPYELLLYRGTGEKVAVVTRDRKYIFDVPGRIAEEYSLADDAGERRNVWNGSERNVVQFMTSLVKRGVLPARDPQ